MIIEEIAKRNRSNYDEILALREQLARETVEKENLFNNNPFDEKIWADWRNSLDRLHIWCASDYAITNSYIKNWREKIGN
jgi:hypothetical protein